MSDVESEPRPGWAGRVAVSSGPGAFAYVPEQVVTSEPDRARELAVDLFPQNEIQVDQLQNARGRYSRLRRVPDVPLFVRHLRAFGVQAQPNHVFFAHCDDPCCGRPHPALRCGDAGGAGANPVYASPVYASPVYASPVYASPVYASPVYASPVYASPVYASPVYASPVYASPVYASPVYASEYLATGRRASSARPVTPADAAELAKALGLVEAPKKAGEPDVVVLDTGLSCQGTFRPAALANLESLVTPGGGAGQAQDVPDAVPVPPDTLLDPAAGHGTFIAGLVERVAPGAAVEVWRVLQPEGDGDEVSIAWAIESLPRRDSRGAILNLSFGGHVLDHPEVIAAAVRTAQANGYVVVASAGNDAVCRKTYPAALPGVVSVGAIGPGGPAPFTNFGPWVRACAPGVDLLSTFFEDFKGAATALDPHHPDPDDFDGWARWSGTSFSAPVVAGALAHQMLAYGLSAQEAVAKVIDGPSLLRLADLGTVVNVL
jgi:Subtilase family